MFEGKSDYNFILFILVVVHWVTVAPSPGLKRSKRDVFHPVLFSIKLKKSITIYPLLPHVFISSTEKTLLAPRRVNTRQCCALHQAQYRAHIDTFNLQSYKEFSLSCCHLVAAFRNIRLNILWEVDLDKATDRHEKNLDCEVLKFPQHSTLHFQQVVYK